MDGVLGVNIKGFKMNIDGEFQEWIKEKVKKICPLNKRGRIGVLRLYRYKDRNCHAVVGSNGGVQILGAKGINLQCKN